MISMAFLLKKNFFFNYHDFSTTDGSAVAKLKRREQIQEKSEKSGK